MLLLKIYTDPNRPAFIKVKEFPFTIGRSYKNNFVVDNPSISTNHVQIEKNEMGHFVIKDVESKNGIICNGEKVTELEILENKEIYLGEIKIELICQDDHLEKTREFELPPEMLLKTKYTYITALLSAFFIIVPEIIKIFFTDPIIDGEYGDYIVGLVLLCATSLAFSTVLAIISKIHCKQYQFYKIIFWINLWFGILSLYTFIPTYFYFYLNSFTLESYARMLLPVLLFCILVYFVLRIIFTNIRKQTVIINLSVFFVAGFVLRFMIQNFDDSVGQDNYWGSVAYPITNINEKSTGLKKLSKSLSESFKKIDSYREKTLLKEKLAKDKDLQKNAKFDD